MDWGKLLKPEDLPESYQTLADLIGLDNTMILAQAFHGRPIYLKDPDKLFLPVKIRYIKENFKRSNHYSLSVVTGLSVRYIYKLTETPGDAAAQTSLFDSD